LPKGGFLFNDDEVSEHYEHEKKRTRRPLSAEIEQDVREKYELAALVRDPHCTEAQYVTFLRSRLKLPDGSKRFREYMQIWKRYHGSLRKP
jgi:hypothetical protein